jgi:peptide deformylase
MQELELVAADHPALRKISVPANPAECAELVKVLTRLMREHRGLGLSAPQVGINKCVFVVNSRYLKEQGYWFGEIPETDGAVALINPVIEGRGKMRIEEEGCLSFPPKLRVKVPRKERCVYSCLGVDGKRYPGKAGGLLARVLLHEKDHLEGHLITDYR